MTTEKPNLSGCMIWSLVISFLFALIAICIFVAIFMLGFNISNDTTSVVLPDEEVKVISATPSTTVDLGKVNPPSEPILFQNGKCKIETSDDVDKLTENVAKFYACDMLKDQNPTVEKWGEENSDKYFIVPFISSDSTDRENGNINAYDLKNFETLSILPTNSTALSILSTQVLNEKYIVFFVGSPTGDTCQYIITDQMYPMCKYLTQDLEEVGGWYLLETDTYNIQKLFGTTI
jgi:hypothetical protein